MYPGMINTLKNFLKIYNIHRTLHERVISSPSLFFRLYCPTDEQRPPPYSSSWLYLLPSPASLSGMRPNRHASVFQACLGCVVHLRAPTAWRSWLICPRAFYKCNPPNPILALVGPFNLQNTSLRYLDFCNNWLKFLFLNTCKKHT